MEMEGVLTQGSLGIALAHMLEVLKKCGWFPWLNGDTERANRIVSLAAAIVIGIGVKMTFEGDLDSGGSVQLAWPSLAQMLDGARHAVVQAGWQILYYRAAIKATPL
mgnify:CR=1 FL=1